MNHLSIKNELWSGGRMAHLIAYWKQRLLKLFKKRSAEENISKPDGRICIESPGYICLVEACLPPLVTA